MLSSTSNSDKRRWLLTWVAVLAMVLSALGTYEWYLRQSGFTPSVDANQKLWQFYRHQAKGQKQVLVLLGASRMQLGMHTDTIRQQLPDYKVLPLAINGQYPMASLQALAEDSEFNGVVIMSFMAQMLEPQYLDMQQAYHEAYVRGFSYYRSTDAYITAWLQSKLAFLHPLLGLQEVVEYLQAKGRFPDPFYVRNHLDTSASGNYALADTVQLQKHFVDDKKVNYQQNPPMDAALWQQQGDRLAKHIEAIRARGGEVVLVRFPTDGEHWLLDEAYYPRARFWDQLQASHPQLHMLHFKDDAILSSFALPDTSHLDQQDAVLFTQRLLELLQQRQWLPAL